MNRIIKTLLIVETTAVLVPYVFAQTSSTTSTSGASPSGSSSTLQSSTTQSSANNSNQATSANQASSTTVTGTDSQFSNTQSNNTITSPSGTTLGSGSFQQSSTTMFNDRGSYSLDSFQTQSGTPGQVPSTFRGEISTVMTAPPGAGVAAIDNGSFGVVSNRTGELLTGGLGNPTTMIPADFLGTTGVARPRAFTPEFNAYARNRMTNRQIMGPMSVIHTGAAPLKPSVLIVNDILHEGLNHNVSGGMIMEAPGSDQVALNTRGVRQYRTLAVNRDVIRRNLAIKQPLNAPM